MLDWKPSFSYFIGSFLPIFMKNNLNLSKKYFAGWKGLSLKKMIFKSWKIIKMIL